MREDVQDAEDTGAKSDTDTEIDKLVRRLEEEKAKQAEEKRASATQAPTGAVSGAEGQRPPNGKGGSL